MNLQFIHSNNGYKLTDVNAWFCSSLRLWAMEWSVNFPLIIYIKYNILNEYVPVNQNELSKNSKILGGLFSMIKCICFDMDNTLYPESRNIYKASYKSYCKDYLTFKLEDTIYERLIDSK